MWGRLETVGSLRPIVNRPAGVSRSVPSPQPTTYKPVKRASYNQRTPSGSAGRAKPLARSRRGVNLFSHLMSPASNPHVDAGHKIHLARTTTAAILCLATCKLLVHLYAGRHYGYFVDELYYLACSRHLDWGYVDQSPLIALMTLDCAVAAWRLSSGDPFLARP